MMNLSSIVVPDREKCLAICTQLKARRKHKHVPSWNYTCISEYALKIVAKHCMMKWWFETDAHNLRDVKDIC